MVKKTLNMSKISNIRLTKKYHSHDSDKRKMIIKLLMPLYFQNKVNLFTLTNIFSFDVKNIEANKEDVKINTSGIWRNSISNSL